MSLLTKEKKKTSARKELFKYPPINTPKPGTTGADVPNIHTSSRPSSPSRSRARP